jgi:hypothetical protein
VERTRAGFRPGRSARADRSRWPRRELVLSASCPDPSVASPALETRRSPKSRA